MYIQELGYVTLLKKIYTRTKLYYRVAKAWLLLHMCGMLYASMIDVHTIYIHAHCLCQFLVFERCNRVAPPFVPY